MRNIAPRQAIAALKQKMDRSASVGVIFFMRSRKAISVRTNTPYRQKILRNDKNLLRFGILYFAARSVTTHVDVRVGFERIENQARFTWRGFGRWKLRGTGSRGTLLDRGLRRVGGRAGGSLTRLSRSCARRWRWNGHRSARMRDVRCVWSRGRLRRTKKVVDWRRNYAAAGQIE